MMRILLFLLCITSCSSFAQTKKDTTRTSQAIDSINRLLDHAVVKKQIPVLKKHYADDFFFQHATGQIDSKASWIQSIQERKNPYLSREHDSVVVELHQQLAVVSGTLTVKVQEPDKVSGYAVRYIRVYGYLKNAWQLVSHHSTAEWRF